MTDNFASNASGLDAPAHDAFTPAQSDTVDLAIATRAIYVGVGGDVKLNTVGGETVTFVALPQGTFLPVRAARIWSTGTTATSLVGMY